MPVFLTQTMMRDAVISFPMLFDLHVDPPASFRIFGFTVYFYGVLVALGFILAFLYCSRQAPRYGIRPDDFSDMMIWLIPLVIVGGLVDLTKGKSPTDDVGNLLGAAIAIVNFFLMENGDRCLMSVLSV